MTWRERMVVRILLMVARMLNQDDAIAGELKTLDTALQVAPRPGDEDDDS